jgi:hypothetical protein
MLAKIHLLLVFNPILAAGLVQALGAAARVIHGTGLVPAFGGLIGAAVSATRPESPNLARGQGGGNEPPRQNQKEKKADFRFKIRTSGRGFGK